MIKNCLTIALVSILTSSIPLSPLFAESWEKSIDASLLMTQNIYNDNWSGGEAGSIAWTFNANLLFQKPLSAKVHNKNTLKLSFGQTHNQNSETKNWSSPAKSTDLVDFETLFRFTLGLFVDPYTAGHLETQFLDVSDPGKHQPINPLKLTESCGIAKVMVKNDNKELTARLGFGLRQLINRDVLVDDITGEREDQTSNGGGFEFITDFSSTFADKKIGFSSKLGLFQAVYFSEADKLKGQPNENYWKDLDINWENRLSAAVAQYLTVELFMQLLYDREVNLAGQFKQSLSLGLTYKFL